MANINLTTSVITLTINGLNTPIKRQRLSVLIKKQTKSKCQLYVIYSYKKPILKYKNTE